MVRKHLITGAAALAAIVAVGSIAAPITHAAEPTSGPTGFFRDGRELTAARIGGAVTGEIDATGFDIAVFNPTSVTNANIHGARYFGVVVAGGNVNTTGSRVHDIGEDPTFDGTQHGRAILYINGADGTISGNKVYDFQKNGIEISGQTADGSGLSADTTSVSVRNNVVTGEGPIDYIAQNGIVIRNGAIAAVTGNTVRDVDYTPASTEATGLLNHEAGKVFVSSNTFVNTEVRIYGVVTANVQGASTITVRPHGVRVDLRSFAQPAEQTVLGSKLDWVVKVDGRTTLHVKQGFAAQSVYRRDFKAGSGRHVIKVFKNGVLARTAIVRA